MSKLSSAVDFATKYHEGQKRKDGSDYINHPLRVMEFLKNYNLPEDVLVAGVLHDIIEDTEITSMEISKMFWTRVSFIINALSKNKKPKNYSKLKKEFEEKIKNKKITNLENYKNVEEYIDFRFHLYINRLYMWILADPAILFIKVADQIDNLSDMKPFSKEKKLRKIKEVEKYFLPMYKKAENIFKYDEKNFDIYKKFIEKLESVINEVKSNL